MNGQMVDAVNISSLIVAVLPERSAEVQAGLEALYGVEVHAVAEDGRMIVTIESDSDGATVQQFETIRQLPGVLSASMVYHQLETDPDEEA